MITNKYNLIVVFTSIQLLYDACARETLSESTTYWGPTMEPNSSHHVGDIIFQQTFKEDTLNFSIWQNEINMNGGYNGEFQIYNNSHQNSYIKDLVDANGNVYGRGLHIKPTLLSDTYGDEFPWNEQLELEGCTDPVGKGCAQNGNSTYALPPCVSARLRTQGFSFKYGRLEIYARLPLGNWLWPAIWLLPTQNHYGPWPLSGEIDLMEARGNENLKTASNEQIGTKQFASTLHFGLDWANDGWSKAHFKKSSPVGLHSDFHKYSLVWNSKGITFLFDDAKVGVVQACSDGFWSRKFGTNVRNVANPYKTKDADFQMAPFNQPFQLVLNVAVGGTNGFFPGDAKGGNGELRSSVWDSGDELTARTQFLRHKDEWYNTWNTNPAMDSSALIISNITLYAV